MSQLAEVVPQIRETFNQPQPDSDGMGRDPMEIDLNILRAIVAYQRNVDPAGKEWKLSGLCNALDWEEIDVIFYPEEKRDRPKKDEGRLDVAAAAKRICAACDVIAVCRGYAIENDINYGVWGGLSENDRKSLKNGQGELTEFEN